MTDLITTIVNHGDTIIVAIVAIVLGVKQLNSGDSALRKRIADEYKERNTQLEDKIKAVQTDIQKTNLEVAKLTGIIQEKDKHIESLTKILQGRNPEMVDLLNEIKNGNENIKDFMKSTYTLIEKVNSDMRYQTQILENSQEREKKIDTASKQHVGAILRTPNGDSKPSSQEDEQK